VVKLKVFKRIITAQGGFSLIELLIAIGISAIITTAIVALTTQTMTVSAANINRMQAVKQVENAMHWLNRDAQMAWGSRIAIDVDQPFPLTLSWDMLGIDETVLKQFTATYSITGDGVLERTLHEQVEDITEITRIAENIDESSTYSFDGQVLTLNLVSTVDGFQPATESRSLVIESRTTQ